MNERADGHRLRLDDGTIWPKLGPLGDLVRALVHGSEVTHEQRNAAIEVIAAYVHIAGHPAGTESILRQVRSLRRAAKLEKESVKART